MGILATAVIVIVAALLLVGAVVFGVLRNRATRGLENTAANADVPGQRR